MGMALVDRAGKLALANRALGQMLLRSRDSLQGAALSDLVYDPDGGNALETLYEDLMAGARDHYRIEGYCTRRDGELAWVNMTVAALRGPGAPMGAAIAMIEDITDKRQAQAALMHAERLTLAGKLAATLAHEINNPLQSVIGCVGLAEEAIAAGESPAEYLSLARSELRRVAQMVGRMRDLHRSPRGETMRRTHINDLLEQVLALSRRQCQERGVRVERLLDPDAPPVLAATDQLRQVFVNMVLNAVEAMPDGGNLMVWSQSTTDPDGVRVTFADDGVGIPPDVLPHIFKAFYSTKPEGTGIGLALTQDIVRRHGGHVEVESEPGAGARFRIWLPASSHGGGTRGTGAEGQTNE
jgi:PAS domain S-box-containing protein